MCKVYGDLLGETYSWVSVNFVGRLRNVIAAMMDILKILSFSFQLTVPTLEKF